MRTTASDRAVAAVVDRPDDPVLMEELARCLGQMLGRAPDGAVVMHMITALRELPGRVSGNLTDPGSRHLSRMMSTCDCLRGVLDGYMSADVVPLLVAVSQGSCHLDSTPTGFDPVDYQAKAVWMIGREWTVLVDDDDGQGLRLTPTGRQVLSELVIALFR